MQDLKVLGVLPKVFVPSMAVTSYHGKARNSKLFLDPQLRLNSGMAQGICELIWLRSLTELGFPMTELSTLFCDNKSTIMLASDQFFMSVLST